MSADGKKQFIVGLYEEMYYDSSGLVVGTQQYLTQLLASQDHGKHWDTGYSTSAISSTTFLNTLYTARSSPDGETVTLLPMCGYQLTATVAHEDSGLSYVELVLVIVFSVFGFVLILAGFGYYYFTRLQKSSPPLSGQEV